MYAITAQAKCTHMPLWALIDCAESRLAGDELVDVAVRSPEVLPRRSWLAQQFDARPSQLVHGRGQVADGEADNRTGGEMVPARIAAAENLDMPPVQKLEDPEIRFRMHQPEAENMLVEKRQFTAAACSRAAPSKARDLHACQYHHDQGSAREPPRSASSSAADQSALGTGHDRAVVPVRRRAHADVCALGRLVIRACAMTFAVMARLSYDTPLTRMSARQ